MRAMFAGIVRVAEDENAAGSKKDGEATLGHLREMTKIAEHEKHAILLSCTRARRQMLASVRATKPTLY